jgi:SAM-dependent methyltransferase
LEADGALGSNLRLPLRDGVADLVVSYGVIHHTPDPIKSFCELARILKPGGRLLLGVYNWDNPYRSLYFFLSPPFKLVHRIFGQRLGDLILQFTVFIPYHLALWLVLVMIQRRFAFPSWSDSWEQFGDFFLTPFARFYMREEMISLGQALGLRLLEHATGGWPRNGFSHFYWFEKPLAQ